MVRAATALGVCRVLSVYWELIPKATIQTFLLKLLQDLAWDASSADVRTSVVTVRSCSEIFRIWIFYFDCKHIRGKKYFLLSVNSAHHPFTKLKHTTKHAFRSTRAIVWCFCSGVLKISGIAEQQKWPLHVLYRKYPRIMLTFSTKISTSKLGVCIICGYICIYVGMLKNTTFVV